MSNFNSTKITAKIHQIIKENISNKAEKPNTDSTKKIIYQSKEKTEFNLKKSFEDALKIFKEMAQERVSISFKFLNKQNLSALKNINKKSPDQRKISEKNIAQKSADLKAAHAIVTDKLKASNTWKNLEELDKKIVSITLDRVLGISQLTPSLGGVSFLEACLADVELPSDIRKTLGNAFEKAETRLIASNLDATPDAHQKTKAPSGKQAADALDELDKLTDSLAKDVAQSAAQNTAAISDDEFDMKVDDLLNNLDVLNQKPSNTSNDKSSIAASPQFAIYTPAPEPTHFSVTDMPAPQRAVFTSTEPTQELAQAKMKIQSVNLGPTELGIGKLQVPPPAKEDNPGSAKLPPTDTPLKPE